jgi:hypothetical protein
LAAFLNGKMPKNEKEKRWEGGQEEECPIWKSMDEMRWEWMNKKGWKAERITFQYEPSPHPIPSMDWMELPHQKICMFNWVKWKDWF